MILNSPTTTDRDRAVIAYLEQVLAIDATEFGREMFERTSDLTSVPADEIVARDVKEYEAGGARRSASLRSRRSGERCPSARDELLQALDAVRERQGDALAALMVTDILAKATELYVSGDRAAVERAFGARRRRWRHRAARGHEPQEAGRAAAACGGIGRRLSPPYLRWRRTRMYAYTTPA